MVYVTRGCVSPGLAVTLYKNLQCRVGTLSFFHCRMETLHTKILQLNLLYVYKIYRLATILPVKVDDPVAKLMSSHFFTESRLQLLLRLGRKIGLN